jgi:PhnB protein
MKTLYPYITFDGNCREAMEFYRECLGGKLFLQAVDDSPLSADLPRRMKRLIVQAVLSHKGFVLMGSDMIHDSGFVRGNNVSIVLACDDEGEAGDCYKKLSEGGRRTHPLAMGHGGVVLGDLTDRYGNYWVLNYSKIEPA